MDNATLEHAFEPFFSTKGFGEGTGLGLATVHGIVLQARGSVQAYSQVGVGTTVKLLLPLAQGSTETPEPLPEPAGGGTETVLVCEDDEFILGLVRLSLTRAGYKVIATQHPRRALDVVEAGQPFDILITDVVMPEMNGPQLSAAAREGRPNMPTLFITGYASSILDSEDLRSDDDILQKPFGPDDLARAVRRLLDRARDPGIG